MAKNYAMDSEKGMGIHAMRIVAYIVLVLVSILCLFWFYVLLINCTRSNGELTQGFQAYPSTHFIDNFINVVNGTLPIFNGMLNSLIVSGFSALLCIYFSAMTAYSIHVYDYKLKKVIFTTILAIMTIPTQVTALGFVQLVLGMGLSDNFIPLIIPAIASPTVFFYMKQYMDSSLPLSVVEAARIDGSGEFMTFNVIVLPMLKPALAVQAIFTFVGCWNNYFTPNLIITKDNMKTLPILIAQLRGADYLKFDMGQVYMLIAVSIFPVVLIYLLLSKYIVGGVTLGAVKG